MHFSNDNICAILSKHPWEFGNFMVENSASFPMLYHAVTMKTDNDYLAQLKRQRIICFI